MTKSLLICAFLLLMVLGFLAIFEAVRSNAAQDMVCFKDYCFYVELAKTPQERTRGLMFRENMDSDKGMFFVFEEEKNHSFWMKNTLLALDIIWVNQGKEVVFMKKNAQPCAGTDCESINPGRKARYVLELNAGIADKIKLQVGDKLTFPSVWSSSDF